MLLWNVSTKMPISSFCPLNFLSFENKNTPQIPFWMLPPNCFPHMRHQLLCLQVGATELITVDIWARCSVHRNATTHFYWANEAWERAHSRSKLVTAVEGSMHSTSLFRNEEMQLSELKKPKVMEPLLILVWTYIILLNHIKLPGNWGKFLKKDHGLKEFCNYSFRDVTMWTTQNTDFQNSIFP